MISLLSAISTEPATSASAVDFTWLFLKMLLVLAIVSILAILFLKYLLPRFMGPLQQGRYFSVLGKYHLEPKKSLYLVNIGKRYLVIGVAEHGISLITEVTKEEVV